MEEEAMKYEIGDAPSSNKLKFSDLDIGQWFYFETDDARKKISRLKVSVKEFFNTNVESLFSVSTVFDGLPVVKLDGKVVFHVIT
jgi:hypothetical protein